MSGYTKMIKYSLLVIDAIICISGLIMLIAGSVIQGQINSQKLSNTIGGFSTPAGSVICIIFGIFVLLFGAFGFYSAAKDRHRFLIVYAGIMSLIFMIQFITGVVGLSVKNSSNFKSYVERVFAPQLNINATNKAEGEFYQRTFKCCGWNGIVDYMVNGTQLNATKSCCKNGQENCDTTRIDELYSEPCNLKITDASRHVIEVACAILVTFSIFNFFSIILSGILAKQIKSGYQYT